jgi:hypothetical protein
MCHVHDGISGDEILCNYREFCEFRFLRGHKAAAERQIHLNSKSHTLSL